MRLRRPAFTLIELLLVLVLLGTLFALAVPEFTRTAEAERLQQSAERIRGLVARCRAEAMNQTVRYRVRIRQDGLLNVRCQADAVHAPHLYIAPTASWAREDVLQPGVWIAELQVLPEGPPPVVIIDQALQFPDMDFKPAKVAELDQPTDIFFDPAGTCNSVRLLLRDHAGRGLLVTVDGRLGDTKTDPWPAATGEEAKQPAPLPPEEEPKYDPEEWQ